MALPKNHPHFQVAVEAFLNDVRKELKLAQEKFPGNNLMLPALFEETGEVSKALIDHQLGNASSDEVYIECIQTAVMALRVALEGDDAFSYKPYYTQVNKEEQP